MDSKYYLTQADLAASQQLVAGLWAQGLEGLVDEVAAKKYRHYYLDNPAGSGTCLLLHDKASDAAIGVQGLIPRTFFRGDQRIDVATLADFVVRPEHRSLGPALKLMRTCIALSKERFAFVYGTPNEKSRAILKRAGVRALGALTRYTKVIRSESFWMTRLPGWLVPPVTAVVDVLIAFADFGRGTLYGRDLRWGERSDFGSEFEHVWRGRSPHVVLGERTPATLSWRYATTDPVSPWRLSLATDRSGVPVGYVVWRQRNGIAMVSDFFCADVDNGARALMQSFARYVRRYPVHRVSLEFFGRPAVTAALTSCGFVPREQSPIVVVEHTDVHVEATRVSPTTVFMTSFDRDHEE